MSVPPTIQIETDIDYNVWDNFEFVTFNYKGDMQYYNNYALRQLTSGILPIVVYPSISPYNEQNKWTPFYFNQNGNGTPPDINPNKPYNDGTVPKGWFNFSGEVNTYLENFVYNDEKGGLMPLSDFIKSKNSLSLFCALYNSQQPTEFICKTSITDDLTFYVLDIQTK